MMTPITSNDGLSSNMMALITSNCGSIAGKSSYPMGTGLGIGYAFGRELLASAAGRALQLQSLWRIPTAAIS